MKKRILIISLAVGTLVGAQAEEKNLMPQFEWERAIDGSFAVGERGRVAVPSDVFGQARNFPNDLRILSADGTQWPFFLHVPKGQLETGQQVPEILNRSFVSGRMPYLGFDLVIPKTSGQVPVHNQVELSISGRDFVRRVEVYAGKGGGLMAVGHLIDFSGQHNAQNSVIRYPSSDAPRLHIRIYANARNTDETFSLTAAKLRSRTVSEVERERVDAQALPVPPREKEEGAQTYFFDLGEPNRPLHALVFDVATPSFARCVSVYGRNTSHEPWKWVGGGEIHALEEDVQLEVELRHARHRYLKLHIFHHDDPPLSIRSIQLEAVPRYLVFEAATEGRASLYYRAWDLKPPAYDLKNRIEPQAIVALPVFQTLEARPNETAKAQPWRKYSKWFGIVAVGGVSLLVIGIIASMLKQQKSENRN